MDCRTCLCACARDPAFDVRIVCNEISFDDLHDDTAFLFPWLFSHARDPELRAHADKVATHYFGPALRETEGAMISELMGHDRMRTALIYDDLKINYDFISESIEAFRIDADRLEKNNLFGRDQPLTELAKQRVEAYKRLRSATARYELAKQPAKEG